MEITNINLGTCPLQYLSVGYVGETGARPVSFNFSAWATEYGAGVLQLLLQRPGDADPYPVLLDIDGTTATWTPDATDTAAQGQGQAQLIYTVGGVVVKNAIFRVLIAPSLGVAGDPPEPYEDWLERLTELAAETQQSAIDAAGSAEAAGTSAGAAAGSAGAAAQSALDAEAAKSGAEAAEQTAQQAAALARAKAAEAAEAAQIAGREADYAQQQRVMAEADAVDAHDSAESAAQSAEDAQAAAERIVDVAAGKMPILEFGEPTVLVDTTTVAFAKDGDNAWFISGANPLPGITFNENTLYKVTWDSVEYECFYVEGMLQSSTRVGTYPFKTIGNLSVIEQDNRYEIDAPFLITRQYKQTETTNVYVLTISTGASHTIKVTAVPFAKTIVDKQYYEETPAGDPVIVAGSGKGSAMIGLPASATGQNALAIGEVTVASGAASFASGLNSKATGMAAHAEGITAVASGQGAHAEGRQTEASGLFAHAEGTRNVASGAAAHTEGQNTTASGSLAHAEGDGTVASGGRSHSEGSYTVANHFAQHVSGQYNVPDPSAAEATERGEYVEIIGNGTADDARSNARTLDWSGNEKLAGDLTIHAGGVNEKKVGDALDTKAPAIIETAGPAAAVTFDDGADGMPVNSLIVDIKPVQTGSGDPSPDNVRLFESPYTGATVSHSGADMSSPTEVIQITFPAAAGAVYGAEIDVLSGELRVKNVRYRFDGTENWQSNGSANIRSYYFTAVAGNTLSANKCECSHAVQYALSVNNAGLGANFATVSGSQSFLIRLDETVVARRDVAAFKAYLAAQAAADTPLEAVATLAEPIVYQLTAEQIRTLLGVNNFWADAGTVTVEYPADTKTYVDAQTAELAGEIDALGGTVDGLSGEVDELESDVTDTQSMIATVETSETASKDYAVGDLLVLGGLLYKVTSAITLGGTIIPDGNVEATTVEAQIAAAGGGDLHKVFDVTLDSDVVHAQHVTCNLPKPTNHIFAYINTKPSTGTTTLVLEMYNVNNVRTNFFNYSGGISTSGKNLTTDVAVMDDFVIDCYADGNESQIRRRFATIQESRAPYSIAKICFGPYNNEAPIPAGSRFVIFA